MTRFRILTRRAILSWANYRSRKAMQRAYPELAILDKRQKECSKSHKRGAAAIIRAKREIVHADLASKLFPDRAERDVERMADRRRLRESW